MTSSESLASMEPWSFRTSFASGSSTDSWLLPEIFSRDNDLLTRALQKSIISSTTTAATAQQQQQTVAAPEPFLEQSPAPTLSNASGGSDLEFSAKRKRGAVPVNGKSTKRRSRASKRSQTTFITADPANFRQMVQQVTGARYGGGVANGLMAQIVKPEPQRVGSRLPPLPTLDTSAFVSNHHQESLIVGGSYMSSAMVPGSMNSLQEIVAAADGGCGGGSGGGVEFDACPSFPTLESWKVM